MTYNKSTIQIAETVVMPGDKPEFNRHELPLIENPDKLGELLRIHWNDRLWPNKAAKSNRFDDPDCGYKVLYAASAIETCALETIVRNDPKLDKGGKFGIEEKLLEGRMISILTFSKSSKIAKFTGATLAKYQISNICTCNDYSGPQAWSKALHQHPHAFDGFSFRSRFDNDHHSYAVFDRSAACLTVEKTINLLDYKPFVQWLFKNAALLRSAKPTPKKKSAPKPK